MGASSAQPWLSDLRLRNELSLSVLGYKVAPEWSECQHSVMPGTQQAQVNVPFSVSQSNTRNPKPFIYLVDIY